MGTVIVAVLAFAGNYLSNHKSNAIWQYRVQQLEEKQDKHNNVIERTFALEKKTAEQDRDTKTAFNQIGEIKESVNKLENNVQQINRDVQELREDEVRIETYMDSHKRS